MASNEDSRPSRQVLPTSVQAESFSKRELVSVLRTPPHYNYVAKLDSERFDCLLCVSASGRLTNQNQSSKADIPLKLRHA
jgi:hypothetical protein